MQYCPWISFRHNYVYFLRPVASGYLLPEHADLVADKEGWNAKRTHLKPWFMDVASYEQRLGYFRESIKRFGAIAVSTKDDPSRPVSWVLRKPGTYLPMIPSKCFIWGGNLHLPLILKLLLPHHPTIWGEVSLPESYIYTSVLARRQHASHATVR